jgi:hypothetical protein
MQKEETSRKRERGHVDTKPYMAAMAWCSALLLIKVIW